MSRYISEVPLQAACEVFGVQMLKKHKRLIEAGEKLTVEVAHGFDAPFTSYFCDLAAKSTAGPAFTVGIYYGGLGLTKEVNRGEYLEAMQKLGLEQAAAAVSLDIPY